MLDKPLERIIVEPSTKATACVIWLHGLGDSGAGFAPVVPALGLPSGHTIRFIFPHAPEQAVTINGGYIMRSWYDIKSMDLHDRADMQGVLDSEVQIKALINEQIALGIDPSNIVLAGFSQGGVMSLFTGLRLQHKLAGIMALSCYLPTADKLPNDLASVNISTPILQQHGVQDEVVALSAGLMAFELLKLQGYDNQWQTYDMGHNVLPEQLRDISKWLQKVLN
ncbi:alpha/beta hydrolase fold domain-containing protein [Shewanella sp. KX20019]|uniref:alpha/beta hydrolase n=1 Tax=Shewanella sp. KX20019 TaxID=2803864 RepID=UPI0019297E15|nr:alpha/beta hydrolase fold domain-containing protein [Shewanella sp. KX20019]QQX82147.1 alpha/beta hydrolase fold domain-containing protein [Shewanella sp. KX20019]